MLLFGGMKRYAVQKIRTKLVEQYAATMLVI